MATKKANELCCVLNATYKCTLCGAVICSPCNTLDQQNNRGPRFNLNTLGHLKEACVASNELACGWKEVE